MKKFDKFLAGQEVFEATEKFKAYLPYDLRPVLSDLVSLIEGMADILSDSMTEEGRKHFSKASFRVSKFYKDNPLIELVDSSPLGKH